MAAKSSGTDMEQNYVTDTLYVYLVVNPEMSPQSTVYIEQAYCNMGKKTNSDL